MDPALHHSVRRPQSRENKARTQGLLRCTEAKAGPRCAPQLPCPVDMASHKHGPWSQSTAQMLTLLLYLLLAGPWARKPQFPHLHNGPYNVLTSGSGFSKAIGWGRFTKVQRWRLFCSDTLLGWAVRTESLRALFLWDLESHQE